MPDNNNSNPFLSLPQAQTAEAAPSNPFLSLPKAPTSSAEAAPVPQEQPPQEAVAQGPTSFNDKLDVLNRGFERFALGGLQLSNSLYRNTIGRLPGAVGKYATNLSNEYDKDITKYNNQQEANYQAAYDRHPAPIVDFLGRAGGATIAGLPAALATTSAGAASVPAIIGQATATGAEAGLTDYSDSTKERLTKGAIGGAASGVFGGAILAGSALAHVLVPRMGSSSFVQKVFNPEAAAKADIAQSVLLDSGNDISSAITKVESAAPQAAKGMTPGEALGGPSTRSNEAAITVDDLSKGPAAASIIPRTEVTKQQIYDTINKMATPEVQATKEKAFKQMAAEYITPEGKISSSPITVTTPGPASNLLDASGTPLPGKSLETNYIPEVLNSNQVLQKKFADIKNTDSPHYTDLPDGSIGQLHKVEQSIKEDLFKSRPNPVTGQVVKDLKGTKQAELMHAQDLIKPILQSSPSYNEAMAATSKIKIQEHYLDLLNAKKAAPGQQGDLTLEQMFDATMPQKMLQNKFLKDVVATDGDPQAAAGLIRVADSLRKSPLLKVLANTKNGENTTSIAGRDLGVVQKFVSNLTLDRYYRAMLNVTLSGDKWVPEISQVLQKKAGEAQQIGFLKLLTKAASMAAPKVLNAATTEMGRFITGDNNGN